MSFQLAHENAARFARNIPVLPIRDSPFLLREGTKVVRHYFNRGIAEK
jgi:hypothetical protein